MAAESKAWFVYWLFYGVFDYAQTDSRVHIVIAKAMPLD